MRPGTMAPSWTIPTRARFAALVAAGLLALAACSSGPSAAPSGSSGWHRVTTPAGGYALDQVVADGSGVIAVGSGGMSGPGISWTSTDGSTWNEGPAAAALASIPLVAVAETSAGLVGLGADCTSGRCGTGNVKTLRASTGGAWMVGTDVACPEPNEPQTSMGTNALETRVVAGGPVLVAVGFGTGEDLSGAEASPGQSVTHGMAVTNACVWSSTDGTTWAAVPDGPAFDKAEMLSVVYAKGEYLAVGEVRAEVPVLAPTARTDASVWTSPGGSTWTREPDGPAFADGTMQSVTAGGPGFVAVGTGSKGAAVWTSPDGTTWTRAPDAPSLDGTEMHGVAAGPGGLVAVGYDGAGAVVWHSTDGVSWTRVPTGSDFAGAQALSVAALGDRFVAVGGASPAGNPQAYVWVGG